ncbi:MAG: patatin-like phospholipase family protein [Puniceicoccales bacterium]|nr:patatin-like phospholipase family protein [Puniceicoccales bacterium]
MDKPGHAAEPEGGNFHPVVSIVLKSVVTAVAIGNVVLIAVHVYVSLSVAIASAVLVVAIAALSIWKDATVIAALAEKNPERLCHIWSENVNRVRRGGDASANDAVLEVQYFPSLIARKNEVFAGIVSDATVHGIGEEAISAVIERLNDSFANEFAMQSELKFTRRMSYMVMDDFFYVQDFWARMELGIETHRELARKIDLISFSGGGAKGVCYGPLLEILHSKEAGNIFSPNCKFAGSSAGALAAIMAAFGGTDMRRWHGEMQSAISPFFSDSKLRIAYPTCNGSMCGGLLSGFGPIEVVDRFTASAVADFLGKLQPHQLAALAEDERERISQLMQPYDTSVNREPFMVRFSDIILLRKLPGGTAFASFLYITMWDADNKKTLVASHETTPDFPIAFSARISIALPAIFKMLRIDIPFADGKSTGVHRYCDGGVEHQNPFVASVLDGHTFDNPLFCIFDSDGHAFGRHKSNCDPAVEFPCMQILRALEIADDDLPERRKNILEEIKSRETMIVPHGVLETVSFWASSENVDAAVRQANVAIWRRVCELSRCGACL